jgi:UDP-2,3-diacylglucosamine hydrolase
MYQLQLSTASTICSISDIHVRSPQDERYQLLLEFFHTPTAKRAEVLVFLGDIFDLMVGFHEEYFQIYKDFFSEIESSIKNGKKVFFIAGNHDFHLARLFTHFNLRFPDGSGVRYCPFALEVIYENGEKALFTHGHEIVPRKWKNLSYLGIINSSFANLIANHFVSLATLNKVGDFLAKKSDRHYTFFNEDISRQNFRKWVTPYFQDNYKIIICGHSHVDDLWDIDETGSTFYANNGYFPNSQKFIVIGNNINSHLSVMLNNLR